MATERDLFGLKEQKVNYFYGVTANPEVELKAGTQETLVKQVKQRTIYRYFLRLELSTVMAPWLPFISDI